MTEIAFPPDRLPLYLILSTVNHHRAPERHMYTPTDTAVHRPVRLLADNKQLSPQAVCGSAGESDPQPASMALPSTFLDRLAPELRVSIYKHVFGDSDIIKPGDSTSSLGIDNNQLALNDHTVLTHVPLETSILATNKLIYREAIEVLYHDRTIRATFPELGYLMHERGFVDNAEKVEVADCINGYAMDGSSVILEQLQDLPHMLSVVVLSDCLCLVGAPDEDDDRAWYPSCENIVRTPDFVQKTAEWGVATCFDVGRYQLHGKWGRVQIVNRKLTKLWPSAQNIPEDYDVWNDLGTIWTRWYPPDKLPDMVAMALQTSFRCWVGFHEELTAMSLSGGLSELRDQENAGSISEVDSAKLTILSHFATSNYFRGQSLLRHVRHLKFGGEQRELEWATEYLAANMAVYRSREQPESIRQDTVVRASHWAEVDGGLHCIEFIIEQQKLALAGSPTPYYVLDPVRKQQLIGCNTLRRAIDAFSFDRLAKPGLLRELAPLQFQQLAYLCIATVASPSNLPLPRDPAYRRELDVWSFDLLKRHLLVSDWADPADVEEMSLDDLRNCLITLLRRPDLKEIRTDPPEGIDDDLFFPLAWKWSWEYSNACVDQLQAGRELEKSSDWEED